MKAIFADLTDLHPGQPSTWYMQEAKKKTHTHNVSKGSGSKPKAKAKKAKNIKKEEKVKDVKEDNFFGYKHNRRKESDRLESKFRALRLGGCKSACSGNS